MKTVTEKRYYVTTKFEKYGTYTIMARSKEQAIQMWKDGDWNFDDYESDYGAVSYTHLTLPTIQPV